MMRRLLGLFLLISIILAAPAGAEPVRIQVATLAGNTGLAMVKLMSRPTVTGLNCDFEVFKSPDLAMTKLITGEVDFAALPTNMAAIMYNKGIPLKNAAVIGWGVMYIVGDNNRIKKWRDLKGKEIYVATKGAVSDLLFKYLIGKNGLNPETDLKIQYVASAIEISQLVASGKITLAALPEPWVTQVLIKNKKLKIILDFQKEWQRLEETGEFYPQTCVVVSRKFLQEHPQAAGAFLKELQESLNWINLHPREGGLLAEKYLQISAETVAKGLKRCNLRYSSAAAARPQLERFFSRLAGVTPEAIGGGLPDENFYYHP